MCAHRDRPTRLPSLLSAVAALAAALPVAGQEREGERLHTSRGDARLLPLPKEEDAFGFVVFGDRTGGPAEGIEVLRQAVADTNLLDPDLVMTVGDLIQGYNRTREWMAQMREYREAMSGLRMPWFPVAGNHDVYWRGPGRPAGEHERHYETHFGPLWYAFEHKQCWFVVLYSDEGNPETGEKRFDDPAAQRMSPEQLAWLQDVLRRAGDARHVFVFLHHPRWLPRYGDDWQRVHRALAAAGNVTAVFAGHIHRMRWDGERDGIEYFTLAATGAHLSAEVPGAGYLHHFNVVTVRPGGIEVATLPVGAVLDPRRITGEISDDVAKLEAGGSLRLGAPLAVALDGSIDGELELQVHNPASRPLELTIEPRCHDRRVTFTPGHVHPRLAAGGRSTVRFRVRRPPAPFDDNLAVPAVWVDRDYLGEGLRVSLPSRELAVELTPPPFDVAAAEAKDGALVLDGEGDCLRVPASRLRIPQGPVTLEAWLRADDLEGRRALVTKTEGSELGLFVSNGRPSFSIHLDGRYAEAAADEPCLAPGRWHHVAGAYDGSEVRLWVDGELRASAAGSGRRTVNDHPLYVGADPDRAGRPTSFFDGAIDEVRLSARARYEAAFTPEERFPTDEDTLLLLHLDGDHGPWTLDASPHGRHAERLGSACCTLESAAAIR